MSLVRGGARLVTTVVGRDSRVVRMLRPVYNRWLEWTSCGRGIEQTLNGRERFRIDPKYRVHVPEVYEPLVCHYLRDRVGAGATCLNVGAHVGVYALCLSEWAGADGRVYAFEPNPYSRRVLERHVALNARDTRIEIVPMAVSDVSGADRFYALGSVALSAYSRLGAPNPDVGTATSVLVDVEVTTLDTFCQARDLAPDWIVMDIEGYEVAALRGAAGVVRHGRGRLGLVVEMHPNLWQHAGASRDAMESLLKDLSLRPVPLTGQRDPLGEHGMVRLEYAS